MNKVNAKSEWIGTIGEEFEMILEVLSSRIYRGESGFFYVIRFKDDLGNIVKWITKETDESAGCSPEDRVYVSGKIKKLIEHEKGKETVISVTAISFEDE